MTATDVHLMLMQAHQAGTEKQTGVILVNGEQITNTALLGNSDKEITFILDNGTEIPIFDGVKLTSALKCTVRDEKCTELTYWTDVDGNTTRTSLKGDENNPVVTDYVYENGRVVSETNTTCNLKTENTYDTNGRLTATRTRSTAPVNSNNGYNETKAYNSDHLLISSKDHRGFQTTYANDSVYGRMTSVTLPDGQTFNYAYTNNALSGINTTVVNAKTGMTETVAHNFGFTRGLLTRMRSHSRVGAVLREQNALPENEAPQFFLRKKVLKIGDKIKKCIIYVIFEKNIIFSLVFLCFLYYNKCNDDKIVV